MMSPENICLDHNHSTGYVRGALCRNCNSMEGKINNAVRRAKGKSTAQEFITRLVQYWENTKGLTTFVHPTFKTAEEKTALRNKRARLARAKRKCRKTCSRSR